jgi:hypothetical protein
VERQDRREDAEADVEAQEHPRLQRGSMHACERRGTRTTRPAGDVEREDADEDERRPEEQVQRQLHRRVFLGADAGAAERPAEDALRPHFADDPQMPMSSTSAARRSRRTGRRRTESSETNTP